MDACINKEASIEVEKKLETKQNIDSDIFEIIRNGMALAEIEPVNYSPLTLAYIGDAVYELIIRTIVVDEANKAVNKLHKESSGLVKAETQCAMAHAIMDSLTDDEVRVFKRGRNAKSYTKAKNATYSDYRQATGFEALMGYLYISKQSKRMMELISFGLEAVR